VAVPVEAANDAPIVEDAAQRARPARQRRRTRPRRRQRRRARDDTDEGAPVIEDGDNDPKKAVLRQKLEGELLKVTAGKVREYLGTEKFRRHDKDSHDQIGVTNGLAWTPVGRRDADDRGERHAGTGQARDDGKARDVMQESAQAAMSYVRSRARQLGLSPDFYERIDVHIHVPKGRRRRTARAPA